MYGDKNNLPGESGENLPWHELVTRYVGSVRYGAVEIVLHDSRVVQIETTERFRFPKTPDDHRPGRAQ